MDKKAQIGVATVVGVMALGGFYWLGTKSAPTPTPVYPSATALPPVDQVAQDAPTQAPRPAAVVPAVATGTAVAPVAGAPRDTVSLLPAAQVPATNGLAAQTPVLDKTTTVSEGQQVSYVGPSGRPSLVTPMQPSTEVETKTTTTKQITGGQTVSTSSHTVHTASTHKTYKYHKHQKAGNVHVARATKHTVMFAAKLPFRLRP